MANAKVDYILSLKDNTNFSTVAKRVQDAARGFDGLKNQIELSSRTMAVLQRELVTMQTRYGQNAARIKDLTAALNLNSAAVDKDEKAEAKLRAELDKLVTTNARLENSIERKTISIERSKASLEKMAASAGQTSRALADSAKKAESGGSTLSKLRSEALGLASAYVGLEGAAQVAAFAFEGFKIGAGIEQARFNVQTLTGSIERGNEIFDTAIQFGQKYGYTQEDMAKSVGQAATIFNKTNQTTEKTLEVLGRLASLNPAEGFEGAVFAFKELMALDTTSIAERFNIARSEANAMKEAIRDGADPVAVLDDALANMGVTSDVLANRMKGSNGALLEVKLAFEDSKLAAGEFLETIGAPEMLENFARGLKYVSDGLRNFTLQLAKAGGQGRFGVQASVTDAGSYQAYVDGAKQLQAENEKAKQSFLGIPGAATNSWTSIKNLASGYDTTAASARILTQQEWALRQALIEKGLGADDAAQSAINLTMIQNGLVASTNLQIQTQGLNAEEQDRLNQSTVALQQSIMTLAMAHPELIDQIEQVVVQTALHGGSTEELALKIETLTTATELNIATQEALAIAEADVAYASADTTASVYQLTDAQYENANAKLVQGLEAERARQFEEDLALAVAMSAGGALDAEIAAIRLAQAYGIERSEAANLIAMTNELNAARSGRMGSIAGRALEGTLNRVNGVRSGAITAPYQRPERERKGRSGSGTGKSDAVKAKEKEQKDLDKLSDKIEDELADHQEAVRELEADHAKKLIQIELDYIAKSLKAVADFNVNKFNLRNNFKQQLFTIDEDLYQSAIKSEKEYWDESQVMAQAGEGEKAARFYEAAQELVNIKTQNAQELRDLEASIAAEEDEAARARLQRELDRKKEAYAEEERLAAENLDKIRQGQDENKTERQEAITEENADYTNAKKELDEKFVDSINKIVEGYEAVDEATGRTKDAITAMADAIIAQLGRVAGAASATGSAAPPAEPEQRALGGFVGRGIPYEVGEHGRELFVPSQSGAIIPRSRLDSFTEARPDRAIGAGIGSVDINLNIGLTGPASEVNRATGSIQEVIRREVKKQIGDATLRINTRKARG